MKTIHLNLIAFLLLVCTIGCGPNVTVTGKVTFPDGTPLTTGQVLFESPAMLARGRIQSDGTYSITTGELKGIPRGTYQVSISGFEPTYVPAPIGPQGHPMGAPQVIPPVIPIHRDFLDSITSGLTVDVQGRTVFNITVRPPE